MRLAPLPILVIEALFLTTQIAAAGSTPTGPASDATHPVVMQQAADQVARAPVPAQQPYAGTAGTASVQTAVDLEREVFGFALASSLSDPSVGYATWDFSLLSTIAFFGLHINDDGTIASDSGWTVWNSSDLTNLLSTAHSHGTKVVLTIIKQDFSPGTPHMCAALANRTTVVSQTAAQVSDKGVAGVNIDFEGLNGTCPNGQTARSMMTDLARQMRSALPAGSYLSVDTYASSASDSQGFFDVAGLAPNVDSFFVMAYDLEYSNYAYPPTNCPTFCLGPTAPLAAYHYNDTSTASQYVAVVPASTVILGVPYYGRKACVASATPNAIPTGPVAADTYLSASTESSSSEVKPGTYASHRDPNDPSGQERWDTWFNPTLNCTRELYWDDTVSLGLKYDLVNNAGLRGVGIWNLNYGGGATELWSALAGHFRRCTGATVTANPSSPQPAGTQVQVTASSATCVNPLYQFWIRPATGTWTMVQDYSSANTFTWTKTTPAGGYYVGVRVRDAASTLVFDSVASIAYTLTSSPCTAVTLSGAPASPQLSGTPVTFNASGTCPNPNPLYEFWARWQGSSTWHLLRGYSTSPAYNWNSAGAAAGTEYFGVWVKDAGSSTSTFDAYLSMPYTVTAPACASVTVSAVPSSVAHGSGAHVTVTGAAAGCSHPNPLYEFWMRPASSSTWTLIQSWSTSATYDWNSTGAQPGTVYFGVWTRDAASTNAYDAVAGTAVTVT
jgi:spore germination protein YaaH